MHERDEYWYELLMMADSAARALTSKQKSIIIKKSMQAAELQKQRIEAEYGFLRAADYVHRLGFSVEQEDGGWMPSFLYMGLMLPAEKKVLLNRTVLLRVEDYMLSNHPGETEQLEKFREIVCFHELFHVIEEGCAGIYTRNVQVRTRLLNLIPCRRTMDAASEIGAVHFSRIMSNASFSPYVYIQYALAAADA